MSRAAIDCEIGQHRECLDLGRYVSNDDCTRARSTPVVSAYSIILSDIKELSETGVLCVYESSVQTFILSDGMKTAVGFVPVIG